MIRIWHMSPRALQGAPLRPCKLKDGIWMTIVLEQVWAQSTEHKVGQLCSRAMQESMDGGDAKERHGACCTLKTGCAVL